MYTANVLKLNDTLVIRRPKRDFFQTNIKLLRFEQVSLLRQTVLQNTSSVGYGKVNDDTGSIRKNSINE